MTPRVDSRAWTPSLATMLFALLATTLTATLGAYAYVNLRSTQTRWESLVNDHAQQLSDVVLSSTRYSMLLNRKEDVQQTIESIAASPQVESVRVYDKLGTIIGSADGAEIGTRVDLKAEACIRCHTGPEPLKTVPRADRTRIFERNGGERLLGVISPIPNAPDCSAAACHAHPDEQSVLGVLDVVMSLAEEDASLASLERRTMIAALLFAVLAGTLSALFVARFVLRPVKALMRGVRRVASGDLSTEISLPTRNEMSELASAFNQMTRDLSRARSELRGWSSRLETNLQERTAELGRTQRQVAHMEKMASLGRLSAMVAHELNNPLAGIVSYAKLVQRSVAECGLPETERAELERYAQAIAKEATRSGNIVRNLLAFARPSGAALRVQPLSPLLARALMLVHHSLEMSQIAVDVPPFAGDDTLACDGDQIQQALVALLVNAVEAMPNGGSLRVIASGSKDSVTLEIADTGCGIADDQIPHVFEPFYTSKTSSEGSGLGLAVVYGIVQRHGGTIDVTSAIGRGTTFRITLPRVQLEESAPASRSRVKDQRIAATAAPTRTD